MEKLKDKVALVTGGNRGIGKGIARALLQEGAQVAIAARDPEKLRQAAAELDPQVLAVAADVSAEEQVKELFGKVLERFGRLDLLVNNAGAFDGGPIETLSVEAWNRVIGACLTGAFLCTREAFKIMKPQGRGRILNIGSISAQRSRLHAVPYTTAKHGIWGLTQAAALEGRPHGIVVCCLHPGNVRVERRTGTGKPSEQEPMMSVEELAQVAVQMLALPPHINFLEAIVLPTEQLYLGRG